MYPTVSVIYIIVIAAFVSHVSSQDTSTCSCGNFTPTHPQEMTCTKDFAIVGVIKNIGSPSSTDTIPITARIINNIKGITGAIGSNFVFHTHVSRCGIRPAIGSMQFLMGRRVGSQNRIDWCDVSFPSTFENWVYILTTGNNSYLQNCICKIKEEGRLSSNVPGCTIPKDKEQCYYEKAICQRVTSTSCAWKNNEQC